jgi:hypothetical protein
MEEATLASLSLTHVRYVGHLPLAQAQAYDFAESQRPNLVRISMASTRAARPMRCLCDADMGIARGRSTSHVYGPDGLRGPQFYPEAMDQRGTT